MKALLVLFCCMISVNTVAQVKRSPAKYGKVLTNGSTVEVKLVQYGDHTSPYYLIQVTGVNSPIDGKTYQYDQTPAGSKKFFYTRNDKNLLREDNGSYELYINSETIALKEDGKKSKDFDTSKMKVDK